LIAIAALLGSSVEEVYAIRRHHHHSHHNMLQTEKVDDMQTKDPKFAALQKKKKDIEE
jgi:Fe2+ or Zn2+ uptake regulation protein